MNVVQGNNQLLLISSSNYKLCHVPTTSPRYHTVGSKTISYIKTTSTGFTLISNKCKLEIAITFEVEGSGHYWYLLKISVSIKPYLVTSDGELLMV